MSEIPCLNCGTVMEIGSVCNDCGYKCYSGSKLLSVTKPKVESIVYAANNQQDTTKFIETYYSESGGES